LPLTVSTPRKKKGKGGKRKKPAEIHHNFSGTTSQEKRGKKERKGRS